MHATLDYWCRLYCAVRNMNRQEKVTIKKSMKLFGRGPRPDNIQHTIITHSPGTVDQKQGPGTIQGHIGTSKSGKNKRTTLRCCADAAVLGSRISTLFTWLVWLKPHPSGPPHEGDPEAWTWRFAPQGTPSASGNESRAWIKSHRAYPAQPCLYIYSILHSHVYTLF